MRGERTIGSQSLILTSKGGKKKKSNGCFGAICDVIYFLTIIEIQLLLYLSNFEHSIKIQGMYIIPMWPNECSLLFWIHSLRRNMTKAYETLPIYAHETP